MAQVRLEKILPFDDGRLLLAWGEAVDLAWDPEPFYRAIFRRRDQAILPLVEPTFFPETRDRDGGIPRTLGAAARAPRAFAWCRTDRGPVVRILDIAGDEVTVTIEALIKPFIPWALSPDGRILLARSQMSGALRAFEISAEGLRPTRSTGGGSSLGAAADADGWWVLWPDRLEHLARETLEATASYPMTTLATVAVTLAKAAEAPVLAVAAGDRLCVIDLESGSERRLRPLRGQELVHVAVDEAGGVVAGRSESHELALFDLSDEHDAVVLPAPYHEHPPLPGVLASLPGVCLLDGLLYQPINNQVLWHPLDALWTAYPRLDAEPAAGEARKPRPADSETSIGEKLDAILAAYQRRGIDPSGNLRAGLTDSELDTRASRLPFSLPEELRDLFRWRDGHLDPEAFPERCLAFRDQHLLSFAQALEALDEIRSMAAIWQGEDLESPFPLDAVFPIAGFEGSYYGVLCEGSASDHPSLTHPVVSLGEEMEVYFHSLGAMLDTVLEWVEDPTFDARTYAVANELAAWQRHNPGVI